MHIINLKPQISILKVLVAFAALLSGCSVDTTTVEFADENNITDASTTVFHVLGIMSRVQKVAEKNIIVGELRGDLVSPQATAPSAMTRMQQYASGYDTTYNNIRDYYAIVNDYNYFLVKADSMAVNSKRSMMRQGIGAVKTWRAWTYLQLTQLYGTVPFYTEPLLDYTDISNAASFNRKGMEEICSYFIDDLTPYADVEAPDYDAFSYNADNSFESQKFFIPTRLMLGDLYLWRGSVTGNRGDYLAAARCYGEYLRKEGLTGSMSQAWSNRYTAADHSTRTGSWGTIFTRLGDEQISFVPYTNNANYGQVFSLPTVFGQLKPSSAMTALATDAPYCYTGYNADTDNNYAELLDSTWYGTSASPVSLYYTQTSGHPQYTAGDLRSYNPDAADGDANVTVNKYFSSLPIAMTWRVTKVWLRLTEALNRAGYPSTAFIILKYGLSRGNLVKYDDAEELNEIKSGSLDFLDMGDNRSNIGIHARGCGNAESDTLYVLPEDGTKEEKIIKVEDFIIDELALETCFEGNRFFDLMRFAQPQRRGAEFLAERVARRDNPTATKEQLAATTLYQKLLQQDNWYLEK